MLKLCVHVSPALLGSKFTKSWDLAWFVLQPPEYPLQCMVCMFSETFKSSSSGRAEAAHKQILSQEMQLEGRGTFSWSWAPKHSCPPHDAEWRSLCRQGCSWWWKGCFWAQDPSSIAPHLQEWAPAPIKPQPLALRTVCISVPPQPVSFPEFTGKL